MERTYVFSFRIGVFYTLSPQAGIQSIKINGYEERHVVQHYLFRSSFYYCTVQSMMIICLVLVTQMFKEKSERIQASLQDPGEFTVTTTYHNVVSERRVALYSTVCMYVCMVITYSRVWINRVRLPILLVVS